ncbi:MAG: hypothetical protein CML70_10955 [Rhodobacterales bacterium]|nr:MAG: hypothetical protein CML70_10955 [Rhodobacterales bacterium]
MSFMEEIKNINSYSQNNQSNFYNATDEKVDDEDQDNNSFDLAQLLKTGYQKRKFSNTSTVNWLQTWRISNL